MENFGNRIKSLRRKMNLTQEELAERLNVSFQTVSKWERNASLPDITMLPILANFFDVTTDELLGVDLAKKDQKIDEILAEFLRLNTDYDSRTEEFIINAYKTYPNDYRIMDRYMWYMAGDYADNDPKKLLARKEEFLSICDRILDGCKDTRILLDARNMQAKILHAEGKTDEAIKIYGDNFPDWYQTVHQKIEQLFAKDTDEYRAMNKRNFYGLIDFAVSKWVRIYWFDNKLTLKEKVETCEEISDSLTTTRNENDDLIFAVLEHRFLTEFTGRLCQVECDENDIIRIYEKKLLSAKHLTEMIKKDDVIYALAKQYNAENVLKNTIERLKSTKFPAIVRLRKSKRFINLLKKYEENI